MATDSMENPALYAAIGENVKRTREARGMTQQGLASRIGFLRTSVVNIEQGRQRVPLDVLAEIAEALGVTLGDVLPPHCWPSLSATEAQERVLVMQEKLADIRVMLAEIIADL